MFQLLTIFLLILAFIAIFFIYLFYYLQAKNIGRSHHKLERERNDLDDMDQLLELGKTDHAKFVIDQLASRKSDHGSELADILALRMKAYFLMDGFHNALHCGLQLIRQTGESHFLTEIELIEYLARIYAAIGYNEKSYYEYLLLFKKRPNNFEYLFCAASQALEMNQYDTALSLFEKVLQNSPTHYPSMAKLGRIYYEKKLFSQALDYMNKAYLNNYDSNELRYYLALTLMQTSGKDMTALSLLQRVVKDPNWARQGLPHLIKISAKLNNHDIVISGVEDYMQLFDKESSESLCHALKMLQAESYRQIHNLEKACDTWKNIPPESSFYNEANQCYLLFKSFLKEGMFHDYLHLKAEKFVDLCTKICTSMLRAKEMARNYTITGLSLKIISTKVPENESAPLILQPDTLGAIMIQNSENYWDSAYNRWKKSTPNVYIYLELDQSFTNHDLLYNLKDIMDFNDNDKYVITIHIYAFHHVSSAIFPHSEKYNIYVYEPNELQKQIEECSANLLANSQEEKLDTDADLNYQVVKKDFK